MRKQPTQKPLQRVSHTQVVLPESNDRETFAAKPARDISRSGDIRPHLASPIRSV